MTRSEEREQAFLFVFEKAFNMEVEDDEIIAYAEEARLLEPSLFATMLFKETYAHLDEIDAIIEKFAIGWKKERISKVALSVLRLAICEIAFVPSVPNGVSANEAVELAKKYATNDDAAFINGILGAYIRSESADERTGD